MPPADPTRLQAAMEMEHARSATGTDPAAWSQAVSAAALATDFPGRKAPRGDTTADMGNSRGGDDDFLGADTTGIEATGRLRQWYVPLAHVHGMEPVSDPLLTVAVKNHNAKPLRLRVKARVEGYSADAVSTVELAKKGDEAMLSLLPTFFPAAIAPLHDATRATVHLEVDDLDGPVETHRTFRVWLLPRTTAVLFQEDPSTGEYKDRTQRLVQWVTPNAPAVMDTLGAVADRAGGSIAGYQVDADGVRTQVRAMFDALKAHGLRYVNSVVAAGSYDTFVQRVRLPAEALDDHAANCVDGTVLYASLMEAASLRPAVVLIPGHAYVGWRPTPEGPWQFLETTMTATSSFEAAAAAAEATHAQVAAAGKAVIHDVHALRRAGHFPME